METKTGSTNRTIHIEDWKEVYPCICGETHRGDYALYDYMHCNCPHNDGLFLIGGQALCVMCGKVFSVQSEN